MGALRINKVDGTSDFIDLSGFSSASLETTPENSIITLTPIDPTLANTIVTIQRFKTSPQDSVWPSSSDAAYLGIAQLPIEYGYPTLGSDPNVYREYDAVKVATSAIQSALGSSSSDEIVYSEITAIADNVGSITDMKIILEAIDEIVAKSNDQAKTALSDCLATTEAGNTYTDNGCNCEPLGGGINEPCCEACSDAVLKSGLLQIIDVVGPISKKHQYLFENVTVTSGPV